MMSRQCELTGVKPQFGNNVSHAKNKLRRRFEVNLFTKSMYSEVFKSSFRFRVSASGLRTVEHNGGLDAFLRKAKKHQLSSRAANLRKRILETGLK